MILILYLQLLHHKNWEFCPSLIAKKLYAIHNMSNSLYAPHYDSEGNKNVMLLAMHYAPFAGKIESDTNRIQAFIDKGLSICSVDLWGHQNTYGHISANFTTQRGIRNIIKYCEEMQPTIIILDYFWLQQNYYAERYGEDWPEKCQLFFASFPKLRAVLLPIDNPNSSPSSMRKQITRIRGEISYFEITTDDSTLNSLVKYTVLSNDKDSRFKANRSHEAQKWRINGFCVVHRSDVTRQHIEDILSTF